MTLGALLGLSLLAAPPLPTVFIDERADIPWIVVATAHRCGSVRSVEGPRSERDRLLANVKSTPATTTTTTTLRLPLLPGPSLLGEEGELLVVAVEQLLLAHAVTGPVQLRVDNNEAWLELPILNAAAAAAVAAAAFTPAELTSLQERARARVARRRATIGNQARERAQRQACYAVVDDPALPLDIGRRLRARLSAPLLR